ncbi:MAG: zf-HC2 domain-containing protein [Syntrophobacteraceae bacterium]
MDCEQTRELLSEYLDDMLSLELRGELEAHVTTCEPCARELASFRAYLQAMHDLPRVPAPAGFVNAVNRQLDSRPAWRRWIMESFSPLFRGTPLRVASLVTSVLVVILIYQRLLPHRRMAEIPSPQSRTSAQQPSAGGNIASPKPPAAPSPAPALQAPVPGAASLPDDASRPRAKTHEPVPAASNGPLELVVVLYRTQGDREQPGTAIPPVPAGSASPDKAQRDMASVKRARPDSGAPAQTSRPPAGQEHKTDASSSPPPAQEERGTPAASAPAAREARPPVRAESSSSVDVPLRKKERQSETDKQLSDSARGDSRKPSEGLHRPADRNGPGRHIASHASRSSLRDHCQR